MNLGEIWSNTEDTDMCKVLKIGDIIEFNGKYFSDSYCFDEGNSYEVLEVNPIDIKLKTKFIDGETTVEVYPDGFSSFNLIK